VFKVIRGVEVKSEECWLASALGSGRRIGAHCWKRVKRSGPKFWGVVFYMHIWIVPKNRAAFGNAVLSFITW
jgi:hypothetical protein